MKRIVLGIIVAAAIFAAQVSFAEEAEPIGITIGAEAAMEANFTVFGIGPWVDYYKSIGMVDLEAYVQWGPYIVEPSSGWLYAEANVFANIALNDALKLIPGLSLQNTIILADGAYSFAAEPSVKLDAGTFFAKAAVPLALAPEFAASAYLEPGLAFGPAKFKLRGDVGFDPFAFLKAKWYAECKIGPIVAYAYGIATGFGDEISYGQYIGASFSF